MAYLITSAIQIEHWGIPRMYEVYYTLCFGRDMFLLERINFRFKRGTPENLNEIASGMESFSLI
jgi:hypothetical protein